MKKHKQFKMLLSELKPHTYIICGSFIVESCIQAVTDILLIISLIPILTIVSGPSPSQGFESIIYLYWEQTLGILGVSGIWLIAGLTAFVNAIVKIISYYLGLKFAMSATTNIADKVFKSTVYKPFNVFVMNLVQVVIKQYFNLLNRNYLYDPAMQMLIVASKIYII